MRRSRSKARTLRIADLAEREGRAVVVAVNKWDVEDEKQEKQAARPARGIRTPVAAVARRAAGDRVGQDGRGLDRLNAAILKAHAVWNRRVTTAQLNRWLGGMIEQHPPPAPQGKRIKLRYMTQAKTRPPGFVVMCSHPDKLPESYRRYLVNGLRDDFDMPGTPIRLTLRGQGDKNPYKGRRERNAGALKKHLGKRG